jgi:hypothetical protein
MHFIGPSGCMRCHETKCPLLTEFFSLLSAIVTFLPEGDIVGFQHFAVGFNSKTKIIFEVNNIWGGPPAPGWRFFRFFRGKNRKVLRITWNCEENVQIVWLLLQKFPLLLIGGWAVGVAWKKPGARTPVSAGGNLNNNK